MRKPRMLDLFSGAGGSAVGYARAGFEVVGVDLVAQAHYPFEFVQADAIEVLDDALGGSPGWLDTFDAIHASPPCQAYSTTNSLHDIEYPRLVEAVRERLQGTGLLYAIENVVGAPLTNCVTLCGSAFGLNVRRHRRFETSWTIWSPPPCRHDLQPLPLDVTGGGPSKKPRTDGKGGRSRKPRDIAEASAAMGIDWMTRRELNEAVPPAYTTWIGDQMLIALEL